MPPSPALRCSPGRELRRETHKRGRSLEGGLLFREKDDDLALFNEVQSRERDNFLLQSTDDFEDSFSTKLKYFSDIKLGISIPVRGESSDLLNADGEKNDYDWLLTPPDTPLFPSLDDETPTVNLVQRGRPRIQPISISRSSTMEKSQRSSRGSASPHRLSPSPRSGNSVFQSRGRPSSAPHSSPTPSLRHATPTRRPSPSPSKSPTPVPRSPTPTPRRMSTVSGSTVASSSIRGVSPVKTNRVNSASQKMRVWQSNIPGFSSDAPPNLRTSLADRPASYVRGSSPASRYGRDSSSKIGRQSVSPTASRSISSSYSHERDRLSSHSKGSVVSSGDDDVDSLQSVSVGGSDYSASKRVGAFPNNRGLAFSKKPSRTISSSSAPKRSFDSALRQDNRKSPQNMFRPLLSSVPSTTFYVGKASSAHRTMISRNSSVTTSSNASSDQGTSIAPDTEGSDQNHDEVGSECGNVPCHEVQDEVFAFDKADVVNEDIGHESHDGPPSVRHGDFNKEGPKIESVSAPPGETFHPDTDMTSPGAFSILVDFSEANGFEDSICSECGCRYRSTEPVESDVKLCPDCSRKDENLSVTTQTVTTNISEDSPVLSTDISKEYKPLNELKPLMAVPELPEVTDVGESAGIPHGGSVKQEQICNVDQSQSLLRDNSLAGSLPEKGEQRLMDHKEMSQPSVGYSLPNCDTGGQQLMHLKDHPCSKVDVSVNPGISVLLLNRSSSVKGHVVQGRTFTATTIAYDDPTYARDSTNSLRTSVGHGSASASSSVDFSPGKQTETRVQWQLSGRKSDMESYRHDMNIKPQSSGSSFSGISSYTHEAFGFAMSSRDENSEFSVGNREYEVKPTQAASGVQVSASGKMEVDNTNQSSMRKSVLEDNFESSEGCQTMNVSSSELSGCTVNIQLEENAVASFPSYEDSVLYENGEEFRKYQMSASNIEVSTSPESSFREDGLDAAEVPAHSTLVTISEIEIENGHQSTNGSPIVSANMKYDMDECLDPSVSVLLDKDLTTIVSEPNSSDHACCILEESTVLVEGRGGSRARSLTLEEATDTILFCSSIIHNLAYQAASFAIEKENAVLLEGSRPTVTILGKSSADRKDSRSRTANKRSLKSQKARPKRVETDTKSPFNKTENDENAGESLTRNVGLPNKVDSVKPPKLESKCNCTVM